MLFQPGTCYLAWAVFPKNKNSLVATMIASYIWSTMEDKLKQQVLGAFLLVLRPVVRILLRYGIGYREFAEIAKTAFVHIASSDYGIRGRPTNISRVAVMTGLTRKEVKRLREKIKSGDSLVAVKTTPLADVLHHWHSERDLVDPDGNPLQLPFVGDGISFTSLVRRFGGDVPAGAMRTELKRIGAVVEDDDGTLRVVSRGLRPDSTHDNLVTLLVHGAYALLSNVAHNTNPERDGETWAHRIAFSKAVRKADRGQLRRISKDRISEFAESVDDLFMAYEALHQDESLESKDEAIAVGLYYFEERDRNANYKW